jgi:hypothetical protein
MSALTALVEMYAFAPLVADSDGSSGVFLLAGPFAGGAIYWGLYRYYRNTDKSHNFERETTIDSQPVTGNDVKVNELRKTRASRVPGDNRSSHRERVQRLG